MARQIIINGRQQQLKATVEPNNATDKSLQWNIITGTQVAKVDNNGLVTGLNGGTAKLRVSSKSNPNVYADCSITVVHSLYENVKLTKNITVEEKYSKSKNKIVLKKGDKVELLGTLSKINKNNSDATIRKNNKLYVVKKTDVKYLSFNKYHIDSQYNNSVYEDWINNYNPDSRTNYLIWVNQGTQRIIICEKTNGKWKIKYIKGCSTGDIENKQGSTGIHFDVEVQDFGYDYQNNVGKAIHVKWKGSNTNFGNTIHIPIDGSGEEKNIGIAPSSHGCPIISAVFRNTLLSKYGDKLVNSRVLYF